MVVRIITVVLGVFYIAFVWSYTTTCIPTMKFNAASLVKTELRFEYGTILNYVFKDEKPLDTWITVPGTEKVCRVKNYHEYR